LPASFEHATQTLRFQKSRHDKLLDKLQALPENSKAARGTILASFFGQWKPHFGQVVVEYSAGQKFVPV